MGTAGLRGDMRQGGRVMLLTPHGDGWLATRGRLRARECLLLTPHGDGWPDALDGEAVSGIGHLLTPHGDGWPDPRRHQQARKQAPDPSWGRLASGTHFFNSVASFS